MSIFDDADNLGKQVQQKRKAEAAAKAAAAQAAKDLAEQQKRHERAKREGML